MLNNPDEFGHPGAEEIQRKMQEAHRLRAEFIAQSLSAAGRGLAGLLGFGGAASSARRSGADAAPAPTATNASGAAKARAAA